MSGLKTQTTIRDLPRLPRSAVSVLAKEIMMTHMKLASTALRAAVIVGLAIGGVSAATAHPTGTMGGMKMAPGSKMEMKGDEKTVTKTTHHSHMKHHTKAATK
jgi:hypothetical protein